MLNFNSNTFLCITTNSAFVKSAGMFSDAMGLHVFQRNNTKSCSTRRKCSLSVKSTLSTQSIMSSSSRHSVWGKTEYKEGVRPWCNDIPPRGLVFLTPPTVSTHWTSSFLDRECIIKSRQLLDDLEQCGPVLSVLSLWQTSTIQQRPVSKGKNIAILFRVQCSLLSSCCWCLVLRTCWSRFSFLSGQFYQLFCVSVGLLCMHFYSTVTTGTDR